MWKLTSVYIFKLDISHYVLVRAAEIIGISTVTLVFAALFLLVYLSIFYVFIETNEVLQVSSLYILILLIFLLKWIENKACDLLWT